jgi:hypothetical protein
LTVRKAETADGSATSTGKFHRSGDRTTSAHTAAEHDRFDRDVGPQRFKAHDHLSDRREDAQSLGDVASLGEPPMVGVGEGAVHELWVVGLLCVRGWSPLAALLRDEVAAVDVEGTGQ